MSEHLVHAAAAQGAEHAEHDQHPHVKYLYIFYALIVLTIVSWAADKLGADSSPNAKIAVGLVVLSVACLKAMFVMLYFMHLKFEGRWKFVLLAPTMILALAIIAALSPDIGFHYYDQQVPQDSVPAPTHAGGHGSGAHAAGTQSGSPHAGEQPPAGDGAAPEKQH